MCDRVAVVDQGKVIALGTPRELIASLGAEHVIEFDGRRWRGRGGRRGDARARCRASRRSCATARCWRLTVREVHRAVPALLTSLAERGIEPTALSTHHATLEDVFMALTGRRLRDG